MILNLEHVPRMNLMALQPPRLGDMEGGGIESWPEPEAEAGGGWLPLPPSPSTMISLSDQR